MSWLRPHVRKQRIGWPTDSCDRSRSGIRYLCPRLLRRPHSSTFAQVFQMHHYSHMIAGADCFLAIYALRLFARVSTAIRLATEACVRLSLAISESLEGLKHHRTASLS